MKLPGMNPAFGLLTATSSSKLHTSLISCLKTDPKVISKAALARGFFSKTDIGVCIHARSSGDEMTER
ncbi:MAG: hypothetical protein HUJ27_01155 [Rhodobacteraceae bacterium]|nr:hypothetical protein [Paracoccaceae bacterium]